MELTQSTWILDTLVQTVKTAGMAQAQIHLPPEQEAAQRFLTCQMRIESASGMVSERELTVSGIVTYTLIYETATGLNSYVSRNSFEQSIAAANAHAGDQVRLLIAPQSCQARWSDERNCSIEGILQIQAWIIQRAQRFYLSGAAGEGVQTKTAPISGAYLLGSASAETVLKEDVELPAGKPDAFRILNIQGWIEPESLSIQAGQADMKGSAVLQILYSANEKTPLTDFQVRLPFSLQWDAAELAGSNWLSAEGLLGATQIRIFENLQGEKRILAIEAELNLRISGWAEENGDLLLDAYSSQEEALPETEEWSLPGPPLTQEQEFTVTGFLKLPEGASLPAAVDCAIGYPVAEDWQVQQAQAQLSGKMNVQVFTRTGEQTVCIAGSIPFQESVSLPESISRPKLTLLSLTAAPGAEGISLKGRISLSVEGWPITQRSIAVSGTVEPWATELTPGLMLVVAGKGEQTWNLAKRCRITPDQLIELNPALANRSPKAGECVVIEH